jgi:DNA recombination protein RmuC
LVEHLPEEQRAAGSRPAPSTMDITLLLIVLIILLIANGVFMRLILKRRSGRDDNSALLIQNQLQELARTVHSRLGETSKQMHESMRTQLGESTKIVREVTEGLTKLNETNKQVVSFADQLQSLQDVLQNPKRRGVLGEYYLETVLKNVLPPSVYKMQYKIGRSEEGQDLIVDAVIFVQEKMIPIDSKFSLENYNRLAEEKNSVERERLEKQFKQDLKARIDETAKYIRPQDDTMDFALMFIPSEAIFYDLIVNQVGAVKVNTEELIQYAAKKKVNIVSPNSFYAFLQIILHGLRQFEIEKNTEVIRKRVGELGRHIRSYEDFYSKLGNSLRTTVSHYNSAYKELGKIDKDVLRITGDSPGIETELLEKPETEEK